MGMAGMRARSGAGTSDAEPGRLRIELRDPLSRDDATALAHCAQDEAVWAALPKLGEARRSSVARLRLSSEPAVVKRYSEPRAFRLLTFGRRCRAEREARSLDLVGAVLPEHTVRVLAWLEERRFGFVARSFLVTAEFERSFDLRRIKRLDDRERGAAIRAVLAELPTMIARLHAERVFAVTLRGKNVLLQPESGRLALIDLPYARRVARLGARHRVRDLAIASLELRKFLDDESWRGFLTAYRHASEALGARDLASVTEPSVAREAARAGHRTTWSSARRNAKRRFRRSALGEWLTGHRYSRESD
jgi:hypothetical protein